MTFKEILKKFLFFQQKLNEDICNLSTLCSTAKKQSQSTSKDKLSNNMNTNEGENEQSNEAEDVTSVNHSMRKEVHLKEKLILIFWILFFWI